MRAAIEAHDAGADVALVSKIHPVRSHSGAAEGGINAALGNASEDSPEEHAFDTVKGSDYLGDQDAIEILCNEAPGDVYQLEHWGAVFSRTEDGRIAQRPFGAAGEPRTAYAADITGHVLVHVLYEQVMKRDLKVYEEFFVWKLVEHEDRCQGVIAWNLIDGGLATIGAKTVILTTGGAGRLYSGTTNAYACTGDGMAQALRVGVALEDMEMMQFHPTTLAPTGVLITEGTRGEGAYLLNSEGDRFLKSYAPNAMELASRDVISRAEQTEIDAGPRRGRQRHAGHAAPRSGEDSRAPARNPGARDDLCGRRPDLRADPRPAGRPLPHGRRRYGHLGPTSLEGLYAAGECACVSVHGANRLGGNALMETITFGKRAGAHAADWALTHTTVEVPASVEADSERELKELLDRSDGERPWSIRNDAGARARAVCPGRVRRVRRGVRRGRDRARHDGEGAVPEVRVDPLTGLQGDRRRRARRRVPAAGSRPSPRRRSTPRPTRSPRATRTARRPRSTRVRPDGGAARHAGWTVRVVPNLYPALEPDAARARARDANPDLFAARAGRAARTR